MCKNVETRAQNEYFHQNSLCFPMYLQTPFEIAWISNIFFYLPCRLSLQSLPRLLKTCPSLRRRHCPRHRYFQRSLSLIFPLEVVVHCFGTLFFTWCHCLSNCCVPAVRAWSLFRVNSATSMNVNITPTPTPSPPHTQRSITWVCNFRWTLTSPPPQPQAHPIPSVASRGCATSDER